MQMDFLLVLFVCVAAVTDISSRRIPNALVASGLAAAIMMHSFLPSGDGLGTALLGALTGFALFLPMYLLKGMAAGDVKLMAAVGAFAGPPMTFKIALATFVVGGVMAIAMVAWKGKLGMAVVNALALVRPHLFVPAGPSVGGMPYGVAIAVASVIMTLSRHGLL